MTRLALPPLIRPLLHSLRRLGRDQTGSVVAEAVIVLPLFLWAYIALYVYWDVFRANNTVQKAAFTLADMLSREQTDISAAYIDGLDLVADYLIDKNQTAGIRITSIRWNEVDQRFEVHWSASPMARMEPLTTETLQGYADEIPMMSPGDHATILELEADYAPAFDIGMNDQTFRQFVVTRPRFTPCLRLEGAASCSAP